MGSRDLCAKSHDLKLDPASLNHPYHYKPPRTRDITAAGSHKLKCMECLAVLSDEFELVSVG